MADSAKTQSLSRAEYLKRYMSSPSDAKKARKNYKSSKLGGMRLLEEDTFLPTKPTSSKKRAPDSDEDEEEEGMDDIDRALRTLNRKTRKQNQGPGFKTDSFITVEGSADKEENKESTSSDRNSKFDTDKVKTEIKEEVESEDEPTAKVKKRRRMDDGGRSGLLSKEAMLEEERAARERDQQRLAALDVEASGRDAETRRRETGFERRRGKRRDEEDEAKKAREAVKQKELEEKYRSWNRGVAQIKERESKLQEMEQVLEEGFSRYADDKAMNEHLKGQLHEEDPMADYFRVKNHKVQMRTGLVYPTYQGQWAQNRYSIAPGYRWDGVDRSNGFEAKVQLEKNRAKAREELTYKSIAECED